MSEDDEFPRDLCPVCDGQGFDLVGEKCLWCDGQGVVTKDDGIDYEEDEDGIIIPVVDTALSKT